MRPRNNAGFSLVEILVVIIIISILVGFVVINVAHKPDEARRVMAQSNIKSIENALGLYRSAHSNYPSQAQGLHALTEASTLPPVPKNFPKEPYLQKIPLDPWGNEFIYVVPGPGNYPFQVICYGADGEPGGEDANADIISSEL